MSKPKVLSASETDPRELHLFLTKAFDSAKATFLERHGDWAHRGGNNRLVIVDKQAILGYCAVIPTRCLLGTEETSALWWVDLYVAPEMRGLGLQRMFDEHLRGAAGLKLGFPNRLAAKIHVRHGWGVRDDFQICLLPLQPSKLNAVHTPKGLRGLPARGLAAVFSPFAALARWHVASSRSGNSFRLEKPELPTLAETFRRHRPKDLATTLRDEDYLDWRYFQSPHHSDLQFYVSGSPDEPNLVLITRKVSYPQGQAIRLLDLFGEIENRADLVSLIRHVASDAVSAGAFQVTCLVSNRPLRTALRAAGFLVSRRTRFCWYGENHDAREAIGDLAQHWVLADSDNDQPENLPAIRAPQ